MAADIASRLLSSGRALEALETLERADTTGRIDIPVEWQLARLQALEALGRAGEAQADRWTWFEQSLSDVHLRAFLKRLPDFDDLEAEEKALPMLRPIQTSTARLLFCCAGRPRPRPPSLSSRERRTLTAISTS